MFLPWMLTLLIVMLTIKLLGFCCMCLHLCDCVILLKNISSNQQELKILVERLEVLLKQKENAIQKNDLAEKLKHHVDVSQMS